MKKLFLILAVLFVNEFTQAQSRNRSRSKSRSQVNVSSEFGAMGGVNFNSLNINAIDTGDKELEDVGSGNIGFHLGLYATIDLELFAIQPEVYYSIQGGTFDISSTQTQEQTVSLGYIQIPLLGRYNFLEYFHVLAGPQFGIPIKAEVELASGGTVDMKDNFKGLDMAAVIGVGLTIPEYGISGSLRWSKGFTEMIDTVDLDATIPVTSLNNSMIQISASYAFGGGR